MNYNRRALLLATKNQGKVDEIRVALSGMDVEVRSGSDDDNLPDVAETENSLEGNAQLKAQTLYRITGVPTLADDTGLEVSVLDGEPGVRSARFAGEPSDPAANRMLLLKRMETCDDRRARFRTVIAFTDESGTHFFEGICSGTIVHVARGTGGFGYDSLFEPDGYDRTFAELDITVKDRISHRGKALRRFRKFLELHWGMAT